MRWKVDAIIETRFQGPADETRARKLIQAELWKLVERMEEALGSDLSTSVVIIGCESLADES